MDELTLLIMARGIERLLIVTSGLFSIYFGFRLYKEVLFHESELEGGFRDWKITFKRVGPGTAFSLFGAVILFSAMISPIQYQLSPGRPADSEQDSNQPTMNVLQNNVPVSTADATRKNHYFQALSAAIDTLQGIMELQQGIPPELLDQARNNHAVAVSARNMLATDLFSREDLDRYRSLYSKYGETFEEKLPEVASSDEIVRLMNIHAAHNRVSAGE